MTSRKDEGKIACHHARKEMVSFPSLQRMGKNKDYFFSKGDKICIFIKTE